MVPIEPITRVDEQIHNLWRDYFLIFNNMWNIAMIVIKNIKMNYVLNVAYSIDTYA